MKSIVVFISLVLCISSFGQITIEGSSGLQVANNGPAVVVDPALVVTSPLSITEFRVTVSAYNAGDVLNYNAGMLPAGVSGSYSGGVLTFSGTGSAAAYQLLLGTVSFATSSSNAVSRIIRFEAGDGTVKYNSSNGHHYAYVSGSYSWTAAKADAASRTFFGQQGYLATITNSPENTFVLTLPGKGWIGASDAASEGASENNWFWVTGPEQGTKFSTGSSSHNGAFTYWNSGEPNNSSGEHYGENFYAGGRWNDAQNTNNSAYLIEYGGTAGDPVVDVSHAVTVKMIATELKSSLPPVPYKLHAASVVVDAHLTVYSTSTFRQGKATISGNFHTGDHLSSSGTLPGEFSKSFNSSTGVLSFSTTVDVAPAVWQNLFRTVQFSSASDVIGNRDVTFSLGNQVGFTNGHFYEYVSSGTNWDGAKSGAAGKTYLGLQGYLATITSFEENEFIKQKLGANAWIGASDRNTYINPVAGTSYNDQNASEGKWYWITGPEAGTQMTTANAPNGSSLPPVFGTTYNYWNFGEPNNSSSSEHYAQIYASGSNPGKWNDLQGGSSLGYVVEYGGISTDPALFLSANRIISINSILPVTNLEFKAEKGFKETILNWSCFVGPGSEYFYIQHSTDGQVFTSLGTVAATGAPDRLSRFQWIHHSPSEGANYYRLKQTDLDGRFTYSKTVVL